MGTKEITVAGLVVEVTQPYAAGHTLTEAEAKALNQVRAENVANNTRKAINELKSEDGSFSEDAANQARATFAEKDAAYEFTLASVGAHRSVDPLERECRSLARDLLNAKIKAKGLTIKAYKEENGEERYEELLATFAEHPEVVKAAKAALKQRAGLADLDV